MQLLLSDAALARVGGELARFADLDVIALAADGTLRRAGATVPDSAVDPHIFWISADLYLARQLPVFFQRMFQGTQGRWAQGFMAGLDNPVFKQLMAKGIRLTKSNAQAPAIAEYVVAHGLSILHPIAEQARQQADRTWKVVPFREIADAPWLLVGYGNIGREIARRVAAFGAPVSVVRRRGDADPFVREVAAMEALPRLLPSADVVVLCTALNERTAKIADEKFFRAMKPGSTLINIGRGGLVDEAALRAGLDRGQPAHAVLDVFEVEPLPADSWFWTHPAVRVTAHGSNAGSGVQHRGDALFLENLGRFMSNQPLINEATPDEVGL